MVRSSTLKTTGFPEVALFFFIFLILFFLFPLSWLVKEKKKKKLSLCRNIFFVFHLFFILMLLEYS